MMDQTLTRLNGIPCLFLQTDDVQTVIFGSTAECFLLLVSVTTPTHLGGEMVAGVAAAAEARLSDAGAGEAERPAEAGLRLGV